MKSAQGLEMLERIRLICKPLPEVEELVDGHGHDVFKVKGKSFVILGENNSEGTPTLCIKSDKEQQYLLLQQGGYVKTPYIGQHGWVSLDPDASPDWEELTVLIKEAYLQAAPKKLVKQVLETEGNVN